MEELEQKLADAEQERGQAEDAKAENERIRGELDQERSARGALGLRIEELHNELESLKTVNEQLEHNLEVSWLQPPHYGPSSDLCYYV